MNAVIPWLFLLSWEKMLRLGFGWNGPDPIHPPVLSNADITTMERSDGLYPGVQRMKLLLLVHTTRLNLVQAFTT